ncbi:unnamed protein product [Rhizoctonia solani]|uniref:Uncharacterized protein n=1 Tax=Rhizoctonia solani TaxID=456999 RepID=A0A8H3I0P4_9AGAM|nr:unnamed protein product [Rhizoctonia solani]
MPPKSAASAPGSRSCSERENTITNDAASETSARSYKSRITTASKLAKKNPEFADWAKAVKVDPAIKTNLPNDSKFGRIKKLQSDSKELPGWLRDPESKEFDRIPPVYQKWKNTLCSKLKDDPRYRFNESKDLTVPFAIGLILQVYYHDTKIKESDRAALKSETDVRFSIDNLVMYSCDADGDELLVYSTEQKLKLPSIKSSQLSSQVDVSSTTADGIISLDLIQFKPYTLNFPQIQTLLSALSTESLTLNLILVHFVAEYKHDEGENQMKMGVVSALYQKKMLGIEGQFVFGLFQFSGDGLAVVAGVWQDGKIQFYEVGTYTRQSPASLVELYFLLRAIKRLAAEYKTELEKSSTELMSRIKVNPPADEWAARETDTVPEVLEDPSDEPQQAGRSNIPQRMSQALSKLEQWDANDRINAYNKSVR